MISSASHFVHLPDAMVAAPFPSQLQLHRSKCRTFWKASKCLHLRFGVDSSAIDTVAGLSCMSCLRTSGLFGPRICMLYGVFGGPHTSKDYFGAKWAENTFETMAAKSRFVAGDTGDATCRDGL